MSLRSGNHNKQIRTSFPRSKILMRPHIRFRSEKFWLLENVVTVRNGLEEDKTYISVSQIMFMSLINRRFRKHARIGDVPKLYTFYEEYLNPRTSDITAIISKSKMTFVN